MVASAPRNFAEMVTMGMRLEEGVREARLVKESVPTDGSEEKDQEWVWWKVGLNISIRVVTLLSLLCPPPTLFKIQVINPSFNNINNSLDNKLQEQNLIWFPWNMRSCFPICLRRTLSKLDHLSDA